MEHEAVNGTKPKRMRVVWASFGVTALFLIAVIGWGVYMTTRVDTRGPLERFAQQQPQDFPLFYPARLPKGFQLDGSSVVALEGTGVSFTLVGADGKKIYVTQQKRPRLMEEVNKVQEFAVDSGKAYTAELNGRMAGFLVASDTLVIAAPSDNADPAVLRQIIEAMTPLT